MAKIVSIPMAIIMTIVSFFFPYEGKEVNPDEWNTNYPYVFVHGLSGWGSYDTQYKLMPYWGMFGGELLSKLEKKGYDCYAASVAPSSSAWDRACELYAQLTGTTDGGFVVDESWLENDGLVNTVSSFAPSSAPSKEFDKNSIEKGVWQIMPTYQGDHMSLQGGLFKVNTDVFDYYTVHFDMINKL